MTDATELADATANRDPAVGLAAVASLRRLLESLEALQVRNAREQGWSWQQIAEVLGVSKQAVHKKHGSQADPGTAWLMFERFTKEAREVVVLAHEEARAPGAEAIGTEHLLLALAAQPKGTAARVLDGVGLGHAALRAELARAGDGLDAAALAAIGIDLDEVRRRVEAVVRRRCAGPAPPRAAALHAQGQEGARAGAARGAVARRSRDRVRARPARRAAAIPASP